MLGGVDPAMVDINKFGVSSRDQKIGLRQDNADKIDFDKGRRSIEFSAENLAEEVQKIMKSMGF